MPLCDLLAQVDRLDGLSLYQVDQLLRSDLPLPRVDVIDAHHEFHGLLSHIELDCALASLTIVTHTLAIFSRERLAKELQLHHPSTQVWLLAILEDRVKGVQVLFFALTGTTTLTDEEIVEFAVTVGIVQNALCLLLVATSSPALLHVTLETLRHRVVNDKAYITLIDPHAKSDRRNDDLDLIVHPITLNLLPSSIRQLCVIEVAPNTMISPQILS